MRSLTGRGLFINICHCALVAQSIISIDKTMITTLSSTCDCAEQKGTKCHVL